MRRTQYDRLSQQQLGFLFYFKMHQNAFGSRALLAARTEP